MRDNRKKIVSLTVAAACLASAFAFTACGEKAWSLDEPLSYTPSTEAAVSNGGFAVEKGEPLKIVVRAQCSGYTGEELGNALREKNIEPEFCDRDFLVLMATPENSESDFKALTNALKKIKKREPVTLSYPKLSPAEAVVSIRRAVFSKQKSIDVSDAVGKICASPTVSCPPAVPIAVSGELVTRETVAALQYYGIEKISVIE